MGVGGWREGEREGEVWGRRGRARDAGAARARVPTHAVERHIEGAGRHPHLRRRPLAVGREPIVPGGVLGGLTRLQRRAAVACVAADLARLLVRQVPARGQLAVELVHECVVGCVRGGAGGRTQPYDADGEALCKL